MDDLRENAQLLLHGRVHPRLDASHDLHGTLHEGQRGTYRCLSVDVAHLDVGNRADAARFFDDVPEELVENRRWLLERKREDRVPDGPTGDVHIPELARLKGGVVTLDAETTSLEASRQVGQGSSVDELPQDGRRGARQPTDHVDQADGIEAKARKVRVMDEVIPLFLVLVVLIPIPADRQDDARGEVDGDDVRPRDAISIVVRLRHVVIDVHLEERVPVIIGAGRSNPFDLVVLLLNVTLLKRGRRQLHIAIEAVSLQLFDFVWCFFHHMSIALARLEV